MRVTEKRSEEERDRERERETERMTEGCERDIQKGQRNERERESPDTKRSTSWVESTQIESRVSGVRG